MAISWAIERLQVDRYTIPVRWLRLAYKLPAAVLVTVFFAAIAAAFGLVAPRRGKAAGRVGAACCRLWGQTMCAILGVRREVVGSVPRGGVFLVAANHVSYLDILVLASLYPSHFLAKREIASWPVFGWIARGAGTVFIDREQAKDVVRAGRELGARLELGLPLTIFPEGRSSCGVEILPFQPSLLEPAARAGVPCWAASISYETPGSKLPPSRTICWHDSESLLTHFPRLIGLKRVVAKVSFAEAPVLSVDRKVLASTLWEKAMESFVPVRQT
jgi:1-acyl-sn-glycerol-3-phosphate acyltransferase